MLAFVSAAAGAGVGGFVVRRFFPVEVPVIATHATLPGPTLSPYVPHEHEYDHVRGDGKGWRCGICESPKPVEAEA